MPELVLNGVHKHFRDGRGGLVAAVQGVSLTVEAGELLVLVGPSGCGKSTLLRLIAGLEAADLGEIFLGGRVINDVPPADRDVAMVFQNYALFPHLSVSDNLAFGLKFRRVPKAEIRDRVREAAAMLRLEDLLDRKPHQLSGGQRQRVALGRALVRRPRVFLLDEPLSNLDARLRAEMRAEIARLHERVGATMLFVTHDQTEAMTLGRRICVLNGGQVMQTGAPLDVYRRPANTFVAEFIGSPGMNLLRGTLAVEQGRVLFRTDAGAGGRCELALDGDRFHGAARVPGHFIMLGIRPEDLEVVGGAAPDAWAAQVEACEPLGHETILRVSVGGHELAVRVAGAATFTPRQAIHLRCRAGRAVLFDAVTRNALG